MNTIKGFVSISECLFSGWQLLALSTRVRCSRNMLHNVTGSFFMTPGMNEDHLKVLCRFQNVFSQDGTALSFVNEGWVLKKHASQHFR